MHSRWRVLPLVVLLCAACEEGPKMPGPKDQAEGYYIKGNAEYLQGNFEAALKSFDTMKSLSPDDPRLPAALGEVYLTMGRLNEAFTQFELALQRDPKRSTNWSRLGLIHAQLGHVEEARSALRKALALYPRDYNALEQLAELDLKGGEKDAAVKNLLLAAEASPDALKASFVMRAADILMAADRHPEALLLLSEASAKGLKDPLLLTALGDERVRAGELPAAAAAYRESLRVKDRAIIHVALARLYLARGEKDTAEQELAKALETVSGSDVREMTELAGLLATLGRKPDALRILTSLSAEPDHAKDVELQLRTATLARELKEEGTVTTACERIARAGTQLKKCP